MITGIVFGPYLAQIVTLEITGSVWYQITVKIFECFAGVMVGREIIFKKIAKSGKQIIGITFVQSVGTFLFVSLVFAVTFLIAGIPVYLAFVFGGIALGAAAGLILRKVTNAVACFVLLMTGLILSVVAGLCIDLFVYKSFSLNYLLIGMAYSATVANLINEEKLTKIKRLYAPILNLSLVVVIVNLGMPLDYRLIAGAGVFTAVYIISCAIGKIGGAYLGGKITKAPPTVTKYLGLTLLPHSGVSLIFTGIAVNTFLTIDPSLSAVLSGTIVAAAIINEIVAVILAKVAFKKSGEITPDEEKGQDKAQNEGES